MLCYNCKTHHWQLGKWKDNGYMSINLGKHLMRRKMDIGGDEEKVMSSSQSLLVSVRFLNV